MSNSYRGKPKQQSISQPLLKCAWSLGLLTNNLFLLLTLIVLGLFGHSAPVFGQISPGPLSKAHQSLNGPTNCTKCHAVSTKSPSFRCLDCHREIANELQQHKGLHATYPQSGPPGSACVKCHSDHNGENFALLHWDPTPKGFDHSKTGFLLDGKHAGTSCRSCHTAQHISPALRGLIKTTDLNRTWMGLVTSCSSCHEDKHQGRFGANCAQCHSTADWKAAKVDEHGFDHSKTRFPLTGLHQKVSCEQCHKAGSDGKPRYAGVQFAACSSCHTDPHKGEFKQGCESCHSTGGWKKSTFATAFDHSKTRFPLAGKHLEVACLTCHKGGDFKTPIAHAQCADCHKPDPHSGQFASRPDGGRCDSCHSVNGFKPAKFGIADHAKTGFPLVAPHADVKCASCHLPAGTQTRYKIKFALCVDCHQDAHKGQFSGEPWRNRCEQCHTGITFAKSNMTLALHQKTSFPLTGSHVAVACIDCHKPLAGSKVAQFHFANLSCATCHADIHHGEFAGRMSVSTAAGKPIGCEACHSNKDWKDLSRFDHNTTKFALEGSHRAVACTDCHKPPNMELNMLHVQFSKTPTRCLDCHETPHANQFGAREENCASCHNSNKWKPSLFDHEKTAFSLKGGHQDVRCSACHTNTKLVKGNPVLFYKPTSKACADCHGGDVPKAIPHAEISNTKRNMSDAATVSSGVDRKVVSSFSVVGIEQCCSHIFPRFVEPVYGTTFGLSLPSHTVVIGIAVPDRRTGSIEPSAHQSSWLSKYASEDTKGKFISQRCA